MTKTETALLFIVGCIAVLSLFIQLTPQETTQDTTQVIITGVYSTELFTGEVVYYVNYLVDAVPATHDFKQSYEAVQFIEMLEQRYNAIWMQGGDK
jgi:hypothetical protein